MYLRSKNILSSGRARWANNHCEKSEEQKFVTTEQLRSMLKAIETDKSNDSRIRDYAIIYCGFYLALRVGEAVLLRRDHFRLLDRGKVFIPTLKRGVRVPCECSCGRKYRVAALRIGELWPCPRCGKRHKVTYNGPPIDHSPPEIAPYMVEDEVAEYIGAYIKSGMSQEQDCLFGMARMPQTPASDWTLERIFATYAANAGLGNEYSFHALRHGRGMQLWQQFHDLKLIQSMLRHKDIAAAQIYAHLDPQRRDEYKARLSEVHV